ncbi:MAG: nucleotidyltransferase domain-containing protein [Chitinophagaceae bacterium]|nr:nucleotidyltransferase domain-containing protein [Chitinophagaceae bacterium]
MLTTEEVKRNGWLIFEAVSGSKAYGLDTATSDIDIRGVFVLPRAMFYSLDYVPQVANETNDIVYYELGRFIELLGKNNPNILELLNTPETCVLYRHPLMDNIRPELFLSKLCQQSFANYAYTQIKKAYGLEKKIVTPMEEERKPVLAFCYVYADGRSVALSQYLQESNYRQEDLGLSVVPHFRDCYNLYYSSHGQYAGILRKEEANDVCLSSISRGEKPVGLLYFNKDGYSIYCKRYKEYQDWIAKRNDARYNTTLQHGKKYDSKNMMHVFRLLLMAKEIAIEGKINVHREDREYLLDIKRGRFEYDELVQKAETLKKELPALYVDSELIDKPDKEEVNKLLIKMREEYYKEQL